MSAVAEWEAVIGTPPAGDGASVGLPPGLTHLSASSISQYLRCPRQWAIVKILGIKAPPDGGLVSGSAMHKGAEHGMRAKMETGKNPNVAEVADVARDDAVAGIERALAQAEETGLREHLTGDGLVPAAVIDKAARLAGVWAEKAAPACEPVAVEEEFDAEISGVRVTGRLDVIEESRAIRDWKTSGKTPPPADVASTVQTEMYAAATGRPVNYTYFIDQLRGVKVVTIEVPSEDLARASRLAADTVAGVAVGIAAGSFPRKRDGWHCSARWCAFHRGCMAGDYDAALAERVPEYLGGGAS